MTTTHIGLSMVDQALDKKATSYTVLDKDFSLKHPAVLYFGGRLNVYHELACSGIRFAERILEALKITRNKVNFVGVAYQGLSPQESCAEIVHQKLQKQGTLTLKDKKELASYGFDTKRLKYPTYLCELYEDYFKPLITRPLENGGYEKLPLTTAQKNMRNVNIIAHSHGTCALSIFGDLLHEKMIELGYTQIETAQIQQQVFVLGVGATTVLGTSKFTTVNFVSRGDKMVKEGFIPSTFNRIMCRQLPKPRQGCQYYQLTPNESVLTVDELCKKKGDAKDRIEHLARNYLSKGNDEKTSAGRTATKIALDLLAASVCNSIFNAKAMHLHPLTDALNNVQNLAFLHAKQDGDNEMMVFKNSITNPAIALRAQGVNR